VKNAVIPLARSRGVGALSTPSARAGEREGDAVDAPAFRTESGELGEEVSIELRELDRLDPSADAADDVGVRVLGIDRLGHPRPG